jgi:hypothetical protein
VRFKLNGLDRMITARAGDSFIELQVSPPSYLERIRISELGRVSASEGMREMIACTVQNWKDVQDQDGTPVPYSPKNLDLVMASDIDLGDAVMEELRKLCRIGEDEETDGEGDAKSDPTPTPAVPSPGQSS